jgi:hypothetical protein
MILLLLVHQPRESRVVGEIGVLHLMTLRVRAHLPAIRHLTDGANNTYIHTDIKSESIQYSVVILKGSFTIMIIRWLILFLTSLTCDYVLDDHRNVRIWSGDS